MAVERIVNNPWKDHGPVPEGRVMQSLRYAALDYCTDEEDDADLSLWASAGSEVVRRDVSRVRRSQERPPHVPTLDLARISGDDEGGVLEGGVLEMERGAASKPPLAPAPRSAIPAIERSRSVSPVKGERSSKSPPPGTRIEERMARRRDRKALERESMTQRLQLLKAKKKPQEKENLRWKKDSGRGRVLAWENSAELTREIARNKKEAEERARRERMPFGSSSPRFKDASTPLSKVSSSKDSRGSTVSRGRSPAPVDGGGRRTPLADVPLQLGPDRVDSSFGSDIRAMLDRAVAGGASAEGVAGGHHSAVHRAGRGHGAGPAVRGSFEAEDQELWRQEQEVQRRAKELQRELHELEEQRVRLGMRNEELRLRKAAQQELESAESELHGELERRVASLLGERAHKMEEVESFRAEVQAKMGALQAVLGQLAQKEEALAGAYEGSMRELRREYSEGLAARKREAEVRVKQHLAAHLRALRESSSHVPEESTA